MNASLTLMVWLGFLSKQLLCASSSVGLSWFFGFDWVGLSLLLEGEGVVLGEEESIFTHTQVHACGCVCMLTHTHTRATPHTQCTIHSHTPVHTHTMHIHTHTHTHTHMHTHTVACMRTQTYTQAYKHTSIKHTLPARTHTRTHARTHARTHTHTHMHAHTHACAHTHAHPCTRHMHTHTQTHTHTTNKSRDKVLILKHLSLTAFIFPATEMRGRVEVLGCRVISASGGQDGHMLACHLQVCLVSSMKHCSPYFSVATANTLVSTGKTVQQRYSVPR